MEGKQFFNSDPRIGINKPFQKHLPDMPAGSRVAEKWFRRHVIIDHLSKSVLIQILWTGDGYPNAQEEAEIKQGMWWNYVPNELHNDVRVCVNNGYALKPIMFAGSAVGEEHILLQMLPVEVLTPIHITAERYMQPVHEKM